MWGLYDYDAYKVGAVWVSRQSNGENVAYPVNIVNKPGHLYHGTLWLLNDPTEHEWPFSSTLPDYWKNLLLPAPPPVPEGGLVTHPKNPYAPKRDWNIFNWAEDAGYQHQHETSFAYISDAVANGFYVAPPGAPFHPLYKHLTGRG